VSAVCRGIVENLIVLLLVGDSGALMYYDVRVKF
jgi:hypothetical protein